MFLSIKGGGMKASTEFELLMGEIKTKARLAFRLAEKTLGKDSQATNAARYYWYNTIRGCVDGEATMEPMNRTLTKMMEEQVDGH